MKFKTKKINIHVSEHLYDAAIKEARADARTLANWVRKLIIDKINLKK